MNKDFLTTHSHPYLEQYFYDDRVRETVTQLQRFLIANHHVHLFQEATIKNNKLPNGILIESSVNQTMLMPAILRDPGCGFILFRINQVSSSQLPLLSSHIMAFCKQLEKSTPSLQDFLLEAMQYGTSFLKTGQYFPVDLESIFYEIELDQLSADLSQITNSLEIRKIDSSGSSEFIDLLGFIHSGSEYFPQLIHSKWFQIAADYSYRNKWSSIDDINNGFYGIPDTLDEAREYQQWILAAMNYCSFKRSWLCEQLQQYLQEHMQIEVSLVNDRCHAGLFLVEKDNKEYFLQSRGVQLVKNDQSPYLIAGQRESVSWLVQNKKDNYPFDYLGHGISYQSDDSRDYKQLLGESLSGECIHHLHQICANTPLESEKCLAYTFNALVQKNYLNASNLQWHTLYPWVNYHGRYLRKALS